jgi:hypothetical protein
MRRRHRVLHLHGFEDEQRLALADQLAADGLHHLHQPRHRRAHRGYAGFGVCGFGERVGYCERVGRSALEDGDVAGPNGDAHLAIRLLIPLPGSFPREGDLLQR